MFDIISKDNAMDCMDLIHSVYLGMKNNPEQYAGSNSTDGDDNNFVGLLKINDYFNLNIIMNPGIDDADGISCVFQALVEVSEDKYLGYDYADPVHELTLTEAELSADNYDEIFMKKISIYEEKLKDDIISCSYGWKKCMEESNGNDVFLSPEFFNKWFIELSERMDGEFCDFSLAMPSIKHNGHIIRCYLQYAAENTTEKELLLKCMDKDRKDVLEYLYISNTDIIKDLSAGKSIYDIAVSKIESVENKIYRDNSDELSNNFMLAMEIGAMPGILDDIDENANWNGSEECREFAKMVVYHVKKGMSMEEAVCNVKADICFHYDDFVTKAEKKSDYDDFARGFLAGEIFGKPNDKNIGFIKDAEKRWAEDMSAGYYQEVLNDAFKDYSRNNYVLLAKAKER